MHWKQYLQLGLGLTASALLLKGLHNSRELTLEEERVALPGLPAAFAGFRLLQLSDLHLRRRAAVIPELLALVDRLAPDLVCLTGDYAFTALSLADVEAFFTALAARSKVVGVLGNADYREGITHEVHAAWGRHFPLLINRSLCLERGRERLWVTGVDDPHTGRDSLATALAPVPDDAVAVLLAHSPEIVLRPLDPRVRLLLCGHTHGGQICLPGGRALYHNTPLPAHLCAGRHQVGATTLYVSRGVGSTRIPVRWSCPPEATLFTLHPAEL